MLLIIYLIKLRMKTDMGDRIFTSERLPLLDEKTKQKPKDLSKDYGDLCLVADGFAQVYPEHKYLIVECLREMNYTVGMTGDGVSVLVCLLCLFGLALSLKVNTMYASQPFKMQVNDAPALKRADVGIAVAGATDAARAAADIVLTQEGLGTIIHGIFVARAIFQRISNFITYRIAATLQLLFFFFISLFAFRPSDYNEEWPEFFHMPVILLMLITLLNDGTLISIAYDNAFPSQAPNRWNLPCLFAVSSSLGIVACGSSLLLLWFLLDSWNPDGFWQSLGLNGVDYGQITTAIYLKVSVSDFLTLFSARTGTKYFWQIKPATTLLMGAFFALLLSSILSLVWPEGEIEGIPVEGLESDIAIFGFVWIYSLLFFLLQDLVKVQMYAAMYKTNFNNISTTGVVVLPPSAIKLIEDIDTNLEEEGIISHH
jgi:H+-transporting ATPase